MTSTAPAVNSIAVSMMAFSVVLPVAASLCGALLCDARACGGVDEVSGRLLTGVSVVGVCSGSFGFRINCMSGSLLSPVATQRKFWDV